MKKMINVRNMTVCFALTASLLTGCAGTSNNIIRAYTGNDVPVTVNTEATSDFDKALMEFVDKSGFSDQNYMVSPTSFRAALALAVAGADTETKDELIRAMGFNDMDEVNAWYASILQIIDNFDDDISADVKEFKKNKEWYSDDAKKPEGSLVMLNSIWHNTDLRGEFGKEYVKYVEKNYGAKAYDVNSENITDKVNKWIKDGTNGLIPSISNDLSDVNAVLINTLYLKSAWAESFEDYATAPDTFTTVKGEKVEKDFMNQQESFRFYEDTKGKLVALPLNGGVDAVFVIGEVDDVHEALEKASYEDVIVKLPKFEVESSFSQNEFIDFLKEQGAELAFDENADFSVMCPDAPWMITDIIQKTKIKVDEDGLEAAASTAIMMCEAVCPMVEEPKEFIADQPFRFYICGGENDTEVMFCGQIVE